MQLWRRKRKTALVAVAVLLLGAVAVREVRRSRVERYISGEHTEGLIDTLARGIPDDHPDVRFTDVAAAAGLVFRHFPATRTGRLPEDMGSGVALGDADGDGWTDVFLVNTAGALEDAAAGWPATDGRSRLFRNLGDGTFRDVTDESGIELETLGQGAAFWDPDGDGDLDLLVTSYGGLALLENDGAGHFHDATSEAGLAGFEGFWTGIAVGDYDVDGAVDLYVCGYVRYREDLGASRHVSQFGRAIPALLNPSAFEPERNLLFRGRGDGTFEEVAAEAGVDNPTGRSLGAMFCDLSGDGLPDLYVANDVSDNAFYVNLGDGTFADRTHDALIGDYRGAMGLAAGDIDGDRDLDLFITHWVAQENALYLNHQIPGGSSEGSSGPPCPVFVDRAARYGLGHVALEAVGWGTGFFDYDNDGLLDLFVVNGSTIPDGDDPRRLTPQRSQLLWNVPGEVGCREIGAVCGDFFRTAHVGRGGATFDCDLDGDEDLVVVLHGQLAVLLRNDGGNARPALRLRLRQPAGNRFALGAKILVTAGELVQFKELGSQGSYLSQHAAGEVAFGLGTAEIVERIEVTWPDGERSTMGPVALDSLVTWERGRTPRVEPLPGKLAAGRARPDDVERQRLFWRLHGEATSARIGGELERAALLYRRTLALWPGHEDSLYYLGNTLHELGREREALATFERLVAYHPRSNQGWMQIGFIHLPGGERELDDLAAATAAFERCHAINGEETRPVVQLGIVALLRGDLAAAQRWFSDAARTNPRSIEARWFGGLVAYRGGERERAEALLAEAHALAIEGAAGGGSVSNEGDTRAGAAMLAAGGRTLSALLDRWRTLAEREGDIGGEYGVEDGSEE